MNPIHDRPADELPDDFESLQEDLRKFCAKNSIEDVSSNDENTISFALFPYSACDFFKKNY